MALWGWRQRLEWCSQKPRNVKDCWLSPDAGRGQKGFFPRAFRGSTSLPKPWSQTSGLQNCERLYVGCFKPLSLWHCIKAVIGKQYHTSLKIKNDSVFRNVAPVETWGERCSSIEDTFSSLGMCGPSGYALHWSIHAQRNKSGKNPKTCLWVINSGGFLSFCFNLYFLSFPHGYVLLM